MAAGQGRDGATAKLLAWWFRQAGFGQEPKGLGAGDRHRWMGHRERPHQPVHHLLRRRKEGPPSWVSFGVHRSAARRLASWSPQGEA